MSHSPGITSGTFTVELSGEEARQWDKLFPLDADPPAVEMLVNGRKLVGHWGDTTTSGCLFEVEFSAPLDLNIEPCEGLICAWHGCNNQADVRCFDEDSTAFCWEHLSAWCDG